MTGTRDRSGVFGEAADNYEAARPGYPRRLVEDVIAFAALDGAPALEVGAGTGKATVDFAERGVWVTCLEPDARMAAVLSRKVAGHPGVSVVVSNLEDYDGLDGRFGLLFAAQSWHWVDPEKRWTLAYSALRPGGALALFWNTNIVPEGDLKDALVAAHELHGATEAATQTLRPEPAQDFDASQTPPAKELLADERFVDVAFPVYDAAHTFTAQRYTEYLDSVSSYRILPDDRRTALLADVRRIVDEHGGTVTSSSGTMAILARKRR